MAGVEWTNMNKALASASEYMAKQAQIELEAKRTRTAYRASWKKTGSSWQPTSVRKQRIRKNFSATGTLVRSIEGLRKDKNLGIRLEKYAQYIVDGRKPGRGVPPKAIQEWTRNRRLKPKNPETGEFIRATRANKRAMAFMMNRKIKHFGIEPFDFVKIARETTLDQKQKDINQAIKKDIDNFLTNGSSI